MTTTQTEPSAAATGSGPTLIAAAGRSYFPIALVARLPNAMMVVGVLTLVVAGRGSLGLGGWNSAMVGLGTAIFGPLIGAAADRFGQRRVVLFAGIVNSLALMIMAWLVYSPLPDGAILAAAFVIGASAPQVSPMSRSRLVGIIATRLAPERRARVLNTTMAYESAADEIIFVFGPVIVGLLATTMNPVAPVIGAAVLALIFVTAFALHPTADTVRAGAGGTNQQAPIAELFRPLLITVVIGVLGIGLFFGAMLTSLTSFMGDVDRAEQAGLVYGAMGVGSAALALGAAAFPARFSLRARWLAFGLIMLGGTAMLHFAASVWVMLLVLLIIGLGIGPTLVTQFSLAAARSPYGRSATVMTMLSAGIVVGQSAASALTGELAEKLGTQAALFAPVGAAVIISLAGAANWVLTARDH
jgi:MFS family permease